MKWITRDHAKVDRIACPWLIKKFIDKSAKIVRGADTDSRKLTPYSEGLAAIAAGFGVTGKDDYDNMAKQFPLYDALWIL